MSRPPADKPIQPERDVCRSLNRDDAQAEALRVLERENRCLREVVISLTEALLQRVAQRAVDANGPPVGRAPDCAADVLSRPFPGHELLTERERAVLAHIVRGASSRKAAALMSISARTVEFHRANIMMKLGARNAAELVRIVLGD
jgi:DNA-binding CsgD family transcriptional regulator